MKFVIDRSRWKNAKHGLGTTLLLNSQGYMCCLGQVSKQLGASDEQIEGCMGPAGVVGRYGIKDILAPLIGSNYELSGRAMCINDNTTIDDVQRESELISLFATYGHELSFEDSFND